MAYLDYSAHFTYKQVLTYQELNQLGENCEAMYADGTWNFSPAQTRYVAVPPGEFIPSVNSQGWSIAGSGVQLKSADTNPLTIYAPVHFPHGATITSFAVNWYRDDGTATGEASLHRLNWVARTTTELASADSDVATGDHVVTDNTISNGTVDNSAYLYYIQVILTPNNAAGDVLLYGCTVTYTITNPLP